MNDLQQRGHATGAQCETRCPHTHSPEEAAQLVGGLSARTLRDKAGGGQIPFTRIGRTIRFTDEDLSQIIRGGASNPAPLRRDSRRRS